jgi:tRNA dimethylallyltransferase
MSHSKMILVAGPTAAGKSALALDLARKTRGAIINADAMQVYAGLPILTAQPSAVERKEIPHELYGVLDPAERSSAGRWLALAQDAIQRTVASGHTPILVGGTGLYFRALLGGLAQIPPIPDDVRAEAQKLYEEWGGEKFRLALAKLDPASAAKLAKNDRQRLIRAYEVVRHTGKAIGEWQKKERLEVRGQRLGKGISSTSNPQPLASETHLLLPFREELYPACNMRFAEMMERGAVEEVKQFLQRDLDPALPAMKIIGVREIGFYLKGEWTLEQAIAKAQQATRNYAKRQMTWFRNQGFGITQ